jgi:hypothetical protein
MRLNCKPLALLLILIRSTHPSFQILVTLEHRYYYRIYRGYEPFKAKLCFQVGLSINVPH